MPTFGLAIKNFVGPGETPDIDGLYAYAERAEALGFESLWAWDHVILGVEPAFPILDAVGTLTAIAARTSRIKLGTGVLVLPLRNPTVAAKALGTLDVISKGRLILGLAAGWYAREFDAVGIPVKRRGRLFARGDRGADAPLAPDRMGRRGLERIDHRARDPRKRGRVRRAAPRPRGVGRRPDHSHPLSLRAGAGRADRARRRAAAGSGHGRTPGPLDAGPARGLRARAVARARP